MSDFKYSISTALANSPSLPAAALRTIGVSSWHKVRNWLRRSASIKNFDDSLEVINSSFYDIPFTAGLALAYETANNPQAEVLEVNQSPDDNRLTFKAKR